VPRKTFFSTKVKFDHSQFYIVLIIVLLVVEGRLHEERSESSLALHVRRPSLNELVSGVHEDVGSVLGDLQLTHFTATIHSRRNVHRISPNIVLRLLGAHDARYHRAMIQAWDNKSLALIYIS